MVSLLQDGGARRLNYLSDFVTHLITGDELNEDDVAEAKDLYDIPAITQKWVILSVKCKKLLPYPFIWFLNCF